VSTTQQSTPQQKASSAPCPPPPRSTPSLFLQPWGESVFLKLQKKRDRKWTQDELSKKLVKWNESCWKGTVYIIFSATAFLVTFREKYFLDPYFFWTDCNQFPLNYYVPFKTTLFYLIEIGFYLQVCVERTHSLCVWRWCVCVC
jgi:hypothetical protein